MAAKSVSTMALSAMLLVKGDPEANIVGLCNQYSKSVALMNREPSGGDDNCVAAPSSSCNFRGAEWVPWANNDEDLQNNHKMVVGAQDGPSAGCIYHVTGGSKPGIYVSKDCQFSNGKFLKAVPGQWNVVLSPTEGISLWAPSDTQPCPPQPEQCRATKVTGQWQYRYTIPGAVTETWHHGTSKKYTESKEEGWDASVSAEVSSDFEVFGERIVGRISSVVARGSRWSPCS